MMEPIKILNPLATAQTQQSAPQSGTEVVNQASNQAIQQGLHDNNVQNVRQSIANQAQQAGEFAHNLLGATPFTSESVTNTVMQKQYMNNLIQAKQDYANAMASGDEQGMANASQRAQVLREAAQQDGIDISSVGSDKTLAQARASRDVLNIRNHGALLGGNADSGTMYNELYQKARMAGMSDSGADDYAYRKASDYRQRRMQMLNDELYTQGINPNNSINAYGIQILSAMRGEDPSSADVALQTFGVPLNEYTYSRKMDATQRAYDNAMQMANQKYINQKDLTGMQLQTNKEIAQLNANTQLDLMDKKLQGQREMTQVGINPSTGKAAQGNVKLTEGQRKAVNKINAAELDLLRELQKPKEEGEKSAPEGLANAMEVYTNSVEEAKASGEFDTDTIDDMMSRNKFFYDIYQNRYGFKS